MWEKLDSKGRSDLVYAKVAKLAWKSNDKYKNVSITDSTGKILIEPQEERKIWRLYIESLYDKEGKPKIGELQVEEEEEVDEGEKRPEVLKREILLAISEMKEGKAVGVDEIPSQMLKSLGEKALQELCGICQSM